MSTDSLLAVRKNRYVILPIDFEEAWKVNSLLLPPNANRRYFATTPHVTARHLLTAVPRLQSTVKRGDETHEFCEHIQVRRDNADAHGCPDR